MRGPGRQLPLLRSVRAKLLIVLAVLSLPLLVVSLIQLNNYRVDLNEQASATANLKATAAAGSLLSWLESHPTVVKQRNALSSADIEALYARLRRDTDSDNDNPIVVFDSQGEVIRYQPSTSAFPSVSNPLPKAERVA